MAFSRGREPRVRATVGRHVGRRPGAQEEARGARLSTSFGFGQPTFEGSRGILAVAHEEHHAMLRSQDSTLRLLDISLSNQIAFS